MIEPENNLPTDDSENAEADDQQSQKDIHSNGFPDDYEKPETTDDAEADADRLQQASDASEPSFTLNTDE